MPLQKRNRLIEIRRLFVNVRGQAFGQGAGLEPGKSVVFLASPMFQFADKGIEFLRAGLVYPQGEQRAALDAAVKLEKWSVHDGLWIQNGQHHGQLFFLERRLDPNVDHIVCDFEFTAAFQKLLLYKFHGGYILRADTWF